MKRLEWIEGMRGLAASWVLLCHAQPVVLARTGGPSFNFLTNGYLGVDFFFVLSGFIIAKSCADLKERGGGWRDYASARAIRIYVPYLPIGILVYLAYLIVPSKAGEQASLLTSLTLLPFGRPALTPAWSLVCELVFYSLFSLYFVSLRLLLAVLGIWGGATLAAAGLGWHLTPPLSYFLLPLNLWFLLGVFVAWITRGGTSNFMALICLISGVVLLGPQVMAEVPHRAIVGPAFALLVIASCAPWATSHSPGKVLLFLGAASYSVYLIHNPTISVVARVLRHGDYLFVMIATSAIALFAGLIYHLGYEKLALRWARGQVTRQGHARELAAAHGTATGASGAPDNQSPSNDDHPPSGVTPPSLSEKSVSPS